MGLWSHVKQDERPTTFVPEETPSADTEKAFEADAAPPPAHSSERSRENAEIEKGVVKKLDQRLVSIVAVLFLLSFLDRSNIGNALVAGMEEDLNLMSADYSWLLTIFYISYIVFEPLVLCWKIVPPHIWGTVCTLGWGLVSTLQAATYSWSGMMACRFFLGLTEAGYGPGIPYFLSFFFLRHEVGLRIGLFLSAAPLANTFAGALAYGITSGHPSIASWRLLFLVEGIPTLCMAPVAYFFLPDTPEQARYLNEEEKVVARSRGVRQAGDAKRIGGIDWKGVAAALKDLKCWITALMYFSCNISYSSLPVFLPTILREMGFTSINAQGLTAPPYFISFLVTILSTWVADRTQQRGFMVIFLSCVAGIGYVLLVVVESVGVRYFGVFLAACGVFPAIANILPWVTNNQGSDTRRGVGIALLNLVGQCGPLLGTNVFPSSDGPRYVRGFSICAAFIFFNALLAFTLRCLLVWENSRLDRKYGKSTPDRKDESAASENVVDDDSAGVENYGPTFRFVL